jgi:TetR/AcrR family transcriptional regulator, transcriptional repressor for nem operon
MYRPVGMILPVKRATAIGSRQKLLEVSLTLIREKGFTATSVESLCEAAAVTKGAFFHHFKSKDALGVASATYWGECTSASFAAASYHSPSDPLERVLGYLDFRKAMLAGTLSEISCLAGTMVQEVYQSHPDIARACEATITDHAANVEKDIAAAMERYGIEADWTASSLALYTQVVLQGAFVLAKAKDGTQVAIDSIDHLRRYVELLFKKEGRKAG